MFKLSVLLRNSIGILSFCILIGLVFGVQTQQAGSFAGESNPNFLPSPTATPSGTPTPEIPHTLVGSYYTLENNITAKLLLNNKGTLQLAVQPTLYNLQGQELQLPPVTVEPQSHRFVNLQDWVAIGGDSFRSGNIKLFHYGKDLVLGAQIYLTDDARSLSFEEKLTELGKFNSQTQEAVWWMPSAQADLRLVLTNTGNTALSITGTLAKKPSVVSPPRTITVGPHSTRAFDIRDEFPGSGSFLNSDVVALHLEHAGAADALLARIGIYEKSRGYSNVVQFSNPAGGKSSEYQGVGFQIENVGNQQFVPVIVARNVGTDVTTVTAKVPYTRTNGTRATITLPSEQLDPGEMRALNVQGIVQAVAQEAIKIASLEVQYTTAPGTVIVAAHSYSLDHNQVFRVPMWDPFGQRSPTGGYPFRIEGTSVTATYIKNITDVDEDYVAFLVLEDGTIYMIGEKHIAPHETVQIDVKQLRDQQIPDEKGKLLPINVSRGQLQWSLRRKDNLPIDDARASLALIGRSEQVDITKGIVSNYACQNCCTGSFVNGYIVVDQGSASGDEPPDPTTPLEVQSTRSFRAVEVQQTCYAFNYSHYIDAAWYSSDDSLATVSDGTVTAAHAGYVEIYAFWDTQFATHPICNPPLRPNGASPIEEDRAVTDSDVSTLENIEKDEKGKDDNPPTSSDVAGGGCPAGCIFYPLEYDTHVGFEVKPKVSISVPSTAEDGTTVTFSATAQGGTPTAYLWTFSIDSGITGNNPQVNFSSPTSASTTALARWYARPNSDCPTSPPTLSNTHPYYNSKYKITVKVTFQGGSEISKTADFVVNSYWNPAGSVAPATNSGNVQIGFNSGTQRYFVFGPGTMVRNTNPAVINVPSTSQFYNKIVQHEAKHVLQWQSGLNQNTYAVSSFMAVIQNYTDTTLAGLQQQINQAYLAWDFQQGEFYQNNRSTGEIEAYAISDLLAPQYAYQRCGQTTWP